MFLRRLKKSKYLRIVNLVGLSIIFSSLLLSFGFIKKELSYDRFHENAGRIVRFSLQYGTDPVDGRIYGFQKNSPLVTGVPGIEEIVLLEHVSTGVLVKDGKAEVINNFFCASPGFFRVFDLSLLEGDKNSVLDAPGKAVISERYARQLFGDGSPVGKELHLSGRKFSERTIFISGVFADFPETSHFHTDLIVNQPEDRNYWAYVYLLLEPDVDINSVKEAIGVKINDLYKNVTVEVFPYMMPLADIHLHSRVLRELEPNGNIYYIYLIVGANLLLLLIVLFNLWLNAGLIFSFNQKYYQLLRLNGASSFVVVKDENLLALILAVASIFIGGLIAVVAFPRMDLLSVVSVKEIFLLSILFLVLVVGVSLLPVVTRLSATMFRSFQEEKQLSGFTFSKVKYLLIAQYCIVMFIVIVSFGITRQINLIKTSQVGGEQHSILVLKEQPEVVKDRFDLLKAELLKHPEINMVTSAMQLPGSAIRDQIYVYTEKEGASEGRYLPLLVVGNDFLPFFNIKPVAGTVFRETKRTISEEASLFMDALNGSPASAITEEYVINRKAVQQLGFNSPEDAIGKVVNLRQEAGGVGYINRGEIVGVTDEFNYTTTFEESIPLILLQRKMFQSCFLVHLSPNQKQQAVETFNAVWNEVNPDYPADYTFLQDVYSRIYYNELNAEALTRFFSLLCLIIANLGLIIIMTFIIKRKTKEIGIRKVNGATPGDIVRMLNSRFMMWIGIAFMIAIPVSYYVMNRWLQNFAHKTSLDWWVFVLSGLLVFLLSAVSISWQSWQAAMLNPVRSLKSE